ncbi:MAG: hypothetical protein WKF83_16295 [Nocardioidaceae bacterium]
MRVTPSTRSSSDKRVGEPQVARGAERLTGYDGHLGLARGRPRPARADDSISDAADLTTDHARAPTGRRRRHRSALGTPRRRSSLSMSTTMRRRRSKADRISATADRSPLERGDGRPLGDVGDVRGRVRLQVGRRLDDVGGPIIQPTRHPVIA